MDAKAAQIATICECIDHCFSFAMWCEDFAQHVNEEDMISGQDRAFGLVSDATRLQSFLALRKLDDFFGTAKKPTDLTASGLGIDGATVLAEVGKTFLSTDERTMVNTGVAHLTDSLTLEDESELDLQAILKRSTPVFSRLTAELRKLDTTQEAKHWLDQTDDLIKRWKDLQAAKTAAAQAPA